MDKIIFAAALTLLCLGPAHASDKQRARESYRVASQHYNLGEFAEALRDFKEAYRSYEDPTILFNIAQCQRQLGMKQDAIYSYRAYLREAPTPPNRVEVQALVNGLEQALREDASSKARPPGGTIEPAEVARPEKREEAVTPAQSEVVVAQPAPPAAAPRTPVYKKWWLWTAVAAVVVVGAGVGLGVGLSHSSNPSAQTSDGTFHF